MSIKSVLVVIAVASLSACAHIKQSPINLLRPDAGRVAQGAAQPVEIDLASLFKTRPGELVQAALPSGEVVSLRTKEVIVDKERSIWIGRPDGSNELARDTYVVQVGDYVSASIELPDREVVIDGRYDQLMSQVAALGRGLSPDHPDGIPPGRLIANPRPVLESVPTPGPIQPISIRVLVLYSRGLNDSYQGGAIAIHPILEKAKEIARRAMTNSRTYITLDFAAPQNMGIVDFEEAGDNQSTLERLTPAYGLDRWNELTASAKRSANADILVLLTRHAGGTCGVGWIGGYRQHVSDPMVDLTNGSQSGYAVVNISPRGTTQCDDRLTLAHEIGHVLGSMHDRHTEGGNPARGAFEYSFGHRNESKSKFVTIMGYPDAQHPRIEMYSNSDMTDGCLGSPCGVIPGFPDAASNNLGFYSVRAKVANWRYFRDLRLTVVGQGGTVRSSFTDGKPDPGFQTINCPGQCYTTIPSGRRITLTAVPDPGYRFLGWRNSLCSDQPRCDILNQDVGGTIEARFLR